MIKGRLQRGLSDIVNERPPVTHEAKIHYNLVKQHLLSNYVEREVSRVDESRFEEVLARYEGEPVLVHAGLSDIKSAFQCNPYEFLVEKLTDAFSSVLVPGFTPTFRKSGVYHKSYSRPAYGTFPALFLDDADYRTDDAIHSILVKGDYRFDGRDHHATFSENGCWAQLDEENLLYVNVGTDRLTSTQIHYVEENYDVPYYNVVDNEGVIYYDENDHREVVQTNYTYDRLLKWNRDKIQGRLEREAGLSSYDLGGLKLRFFRARDLRHALEPCLRENPYFLIE